MALTLRGKLHEICATGDGMLGIDEAAGSATAHHHHHLTAACKAIAMSSHEMQAPSITEDDLLSFQFKHFGDDSRPAEWFVDAHTALASGLDANHDNEPILGCYSDGKKRTLTDEQIALFRHSEIQQLLRERRLQREDEEEEEYQEQDLDAAEQDDDVDDFQNLATLSDSSLEDGLVGLTQLPTKFKEPKPAHMPSISANPKPRRKKSAAARQRAKRRQSKSTPSEDSASTGSMQRQRIKEVPYDQRNKRRWEAYIEDTDPVHGSMTHRRMMRELDQDSTEMVEVDYGNER